MGKKQFAVIFDNGGGTTLQVGKRGFVHHYDNPTQCAEDVRVLLETDTTDGWDGHEPAGRLEYEYDMERNGGYEWHDSATVKRIIKDGRLEQSFGRNVQNFYDTLGVTIEE